MENDFIKGLLTGGISIGMIIGITCFVYTILSNPVVPYGEKLTIEYENPNQYEHVLPLQL